MDCFVLGSGGMMPMPRRRLTSVAIRLGGRVYLLDCGEGTQVPYKELHLGQRSLALVAVTHLHADHCLGLPGMLMLRAQMPDPAALTLVGPPGLARFVDDVRRDLDLYINYEIQVREWAPERGPIAFEDDLLRLRWEPLDHTTLCLGYRIEEHGRPGRFDPQAARGLNVPAGPLWGELQRGGEVQLTDGTRVRSDQVTGPPRRGRRVAFATDTRPAPGLAPLLDGVDLAFVEAMFLDEHEEEARAKGHMTAAQAASAARQANAARVVLVHISPRYEEADLPRFLDETRALHERIEVGRDGAQLSVPAPE